MRTQVIWSTIVTLGLVLGWLTGGRYLTLLLDHVATVRVAELAVQPLQFDGGNFRIGELSMTASGLDNHHFDLSMTSDSQNRMVLSTGGKSFTLGPRTSPPDPRGRPGIDFVPDAGDRLQFTLDHSFLSWPTPFEFNFMTGFSPSWKRYLYYRLVWTKPSGARLTMLWRYQQTFQSLTGWDRGVMAFDFATGLLRVDIRP